MIKISRMSQSEDVILHENLSLDQMKKFVKVFGVNRDLLIKMSFSRKTLVKDFKNKLGKVKLVDGNYVGVSGFEKVYNEQLRGQDLIYETLVDKSGDVILKTFNEVQKTSNRSGYLSQRGGMAMIGLVRFFKRLSHTFCHILLSAILLSLWGCLAIYNASVKFDSPEDYTLKQVIWLGVSILASILISKIHIKRFLEFIPWLYAAGVGSLIAVIFLGQSINHMRGWFHTEYFSIQPSEFCSLSFACLFVGIIAIY